MGQIFDIIIYFVSPLQRFIRNSGIYAFENAKTTKIFETEYIKSKYIEFVRY